MSDLYKRKLRIIRIIQDIKPIILMDYLFERIYRGAGYKDRQVVGYKDRQVAGYKGSLFFGPESGYL